MGISLLLVSPQIMLGDVIRKAIKDVGEFDLRVTEDFAESLKITRQRNIPLVFLDAELEDRGISIHDIGYALRQLTPKIQLIVITNARTYLPESVNELGPRAYIHKPLDPAEVARLISAIFPPSTQSPTVPVQSAVTVPEIPWLQDVNRAAQHLTRLTLESSAQAALITRGDDLWAYAGQLSRAAAQELTQTIKRYWDREEKSDLLRFVRLTTTNAQHMLYATRLAPEMILALVLDSETPFSTIRVQAGKLAGSLAVSPPDSTDKRRLPAEEAPVSDLPHLSEVLSDVPPPIPPARTAAQPQQPVMSHQPESPEVEPAPVITEQVKGKWEPEVPLPEPVRSGFQSSPPVKLSNPPSPMPEVDYEIAHLDLSISSEEDLATTRKHVPGEEEDEQFAETRKHTFEESRISPHSRPRSITEVARRIVLEPVSPALYNLSYACLLIPRFDRHYLTGDLADRLAEWMQDISVAFSWRLEHLAVRPEYLQWISNVPPSASPGSIMRVVRQETSSRIFAEFPRFARENPSGDFWAPGYLIMGGPSPHPQKLIKDFIKQTRQRQGPVKPNSSG